MRSIGSSFFLAALGAVLAGCATGPRLVATDSDTVVSVAHVADAVVDADVVALGELHQTPDVHRTHHALIAALHRRRPDMVIAMEMFERDVQNVLLQYLNGLIDEQRFLEESRPWPKYERDYRPVIEFAKKNGIIVLAANAPRPLARKASREGVDAVMGDPNVAKVTTAPQDEYWDAFQESMASHAGMFGPGGMERFYGAQCLKDDTMAESITEHLSGYPVEQRPLVVLICGKFHSDYGRGTVQRIRERMPDAKVRVLSAETVGDVAAGVYESDRDVAEFVVVAREPERVEQGAQAQARDEAAAKKAAEAPTSEAAAAPEENPHEGMRPALGFMPEYGGEGGGVGVGQVFPGRPAADAGIEEGDLIVKLNGFDTPDVEIYTEVLDTLQIGKTVTVRVRRGEAEVDLQVKVGMRAAR